jgi:hypothetical protein
VNVRQRQPRIEDPAYLAHVRTLPCLICGSPWTEAAHIRAASLPHGKRYTGKAEKPSDCWAVPLCSHHHREQHSTNELAWWVSYGLDPFVIAIELYAARPGADKPKRERRKQPAKRRERKPPEQRRKVGKGQPLKSANRLPKKGEGRKFNAPRAKEV